MIRNEVNDLDRRIDANFVAHEDLRAKGAAERALRRARGSETADTVTIAQLRFLVTCALDEYHATSRERLGRPGAMAAWMRHFDRTSAEG
jgi:hypothetical protein